VAKPRNPNSDWLTVRIPKAYVPFLQERSDELGISQARYVQNLIEAERISLGKPIIIYPLNYMHQRMELKVAETPPPYLSKKK